MLYHGERPRKSIVTQIASSPRRVGQRNELAVLRTLHDHRRLSRADLARELGLNRSSSGNIIANLLIAGIVREVDEGDRSGRAGRPGILLELVPDAVTFLGVEIGVEHIAVVELDLAARITRSVQEPFDGAGASVDLSLARALDLALNTSAERIARCEGLGIATPSQMDRRGVVRIAPLLGWHNADLAGMARLLLPQQMSVLAENDANAFAIGATYGRRVGRSGVTLLVNLESGVGGGILVDGKLFRGGNGLAGEIGHLRMNPHADAPILEHQIGLWRLLRDYRAHAPDANAGLTDLLQAVRDREPRAVAIAEDWARALAFALTQACRIIDADHIVLGGSVAALYPLVSARLLAHLRGFQEDSFPLPTITAAEDIALGAAFGAACMMHQRYLSPDSDRFAEAEPERDDARAELIA